MTFNREQEEVRFISEMKKIADEYFPLIINNVKKYCELNLIYDYSKDDSFFDKYPKFCEALDLDISQKVFTVKTNLKFTFMYECPDLEFDVQYDPDTKIWNVLNINEDAIYNFKEFLFSWVPMNILLTEVDDKNFSKWVDDQINFVGKYFDNLNLKTSCGELCSIENEKKEVSVFFKETNKGIYCQKIKDQDLVAFMLIEAYGNLSRKSLLLDAMEKINNLENNKNLNIKAF